MSDVSYDPRLFVIAGLVLIVLGFVYFVIDYPMIHRLVVPPSSVVYDDMLLQRLGAIFIHSIGFILSWVFGLLCLFTGWLGLKHG
jgi:hypothetical protein